MKYKHLSALLQKTPSVEEIDPNGGEATATPPTANGETQLEREYVMFYKLTDVSQLFGAAKHIEQEQWEFIAPTGINDKRKGFLRVRCETVNTKKTFTAAIKESIEGVSGRDETEVEVTEDYFNAFKRQCLTGMKKHRFVFPIAGTEGTWEGESEFDGALCFEIDVFTDPTLEGASPWVKVDLEVPAALTELPAFPLGYEKSITNQYNERTEEEASFIADLYANVFTTKAEPEMQTDDQVAE